MFHRFGHLQKVLVKKGDVVKKGQQIATIGSTGNSTSAHLHWDISKTNQGLSYVNGWSKAKVQEVYIEPKHEKNIPINFSHFGWKWLEWYGQGYHPGIDLNGPGAGNSDLGNTIYSPIDGEVAHSYSAGGHNSGWGNLLIIQEKEMSKEYYIKSDLRNALKKLDKDFDHEKAKDHEKIAGRVETLIEDKERLLYANGVLDDLATDRKKQIDALNIKLQDERNAYDQLKKDTDKIVENYKKANEIQAEAILDFEKDRTNWTSDADYRLVNSIPLGRWILKIYDKKQNGTTNQKN